MMLDNAYLGTFPVPVPLTPARREQQIAGAFLAAADTLKDDFDLPAYLGDLGSRCVTLASADAAVMTLAHDGGGLRVAVSWPAGLPVAELFTRPALPGPHRWCFARLAPATQSDLTMPDPRWREFAELALEAGVRSVFCVPMRHHDRPLGVISLLRGRQGGMPGQDLRICAALADAAAAGLLQRQIIREHQEATDQLRTAISELADLDALSHARAAIQAIHAGLPRRSPNPAPG